MRVLVTGGAGYIGCVVVDGLIRRGHEVVVFDTLYWGRESLGDFEEYNRTVDVIEGDCRSSKDVIYALEGVDAVIHLAGIVGDFACKSYHKAHFSSNVESTRTLVNCCTDPELDLVRDFIFASSCSVYGNVEGIHEEVTEETPPSPISSYAYAKLLSEKIILNRAKEVPHFHPTILRLATVFGWSERPRLDLVTNLFTYEAWKNKKVRITGTGEQRRSLVHVKDVARAFVDVLEAERFLRSGEIFHVSNMDNNRTVEEIAEEVGQVLPKTSIEYMEDGSTDKRDYWISCQKLKNTIGWETRHSLAYGIRDLIKKFELYDWDWGSDKYRNSSFEYI